VGLRTARRQPIAENAQVTITVADTVECISVEGRARRVAQGDAGIDPMVTRYLDKYWPDPAMHQQMGAFIRGHAIVEVTPQRAFGIIEREDEFAQRATRWVW
jgi:hypothetical protein